MLLVIRLAWLERKLNMWQYDSKIKTTAVPLVIWVLDKVPTSHLQVTMCSNITEIK